MIPLLQKPRILFLDDDPSIQRLVATLLRREGWRVDLVSTGRQAIEKIGRFDYDALLLDLMTPTEGGMTVIRHLRETDPAKLRTVILVTASPAAVLRTASRDVFSVVKKPFEPQTLVDTVRKLL